jgi:serine/threonine-protein kinase TTK/MPS1
VISPTTNKIYALKKVSFDKADQSAIAGYKNEIKLLNRLAERENSSGIESRCIRLFDWESCDSQGYLLMVKTPSPHFFVFFDDVMLTIVS